MGRLPGRLGRLTARDVMTPDIVSLSVDDPLDAAIRTLRERHITGAPVVDAAGKLVGLLSISDLVGEPPDAAGAEESPPVTLAHGDDGTSWDLFDRAVPLDDRAHTGTVAERMTTRVACVSDDAPLVEVARAMCDGHWHRVPVVDGNESLVGIVSTMDVLAALVNAADEPE